MEAVAHAGMYYFFKAYVVFITKQVYSKVRKFADIFLYNNILCLSDVNGFQQLYSISFPEVLF